MKGAGENLSRRTETKPATDGRRWQMMGSGEAVGPGAGPAPGPILAVYPLPSVAKKFSLTTGIAAVARI